MDYPENKKQFWETFRDHIIARDGENAYTYKRPGTSFYLCYIYFKHGYIVIYGDMGPFIFNTDSPDSFKWASSGLESTSYVMSKLKNESRRYDGEETYKRMKESLADDEESMKDFEERKDELFFEENYAHSIVSDFGGDTDDVIYTWDANPDAQWAYWVLRTFMDKLKASPLPPYGKTCDDCAVEERSHEDGMSAWCPEAKMKVNEHTPACMNFRRS